MTTAVKVPFQLWTGSTADRDALASVRDFAARAHCILRAPHHTVSTTAMIGKATGHREFDRRWIADHRQDPPPPAARTPQHIHEKHPSQ